MEKLNLPKWSGWLLFGLSITIIVLLIMLKNQKVDSKIVDKKAEQKELKKQIDSLIEHESTIIIEASIQSKNSVKESKKLIKSLPNEKSNVRPIDYDSMCKYISNYSSK